VALACRACRVSLAASAGCAVCDPVRRHLVVTDEADEEEAGLAGTAREVVAALRAQLRTVRSALTADRNDERAEKRLIGLGNTAAKVLESARKLQQDGVGAVEAMAFTERAELFIGWLATLPPAYRASVRERWDRWELEVARPLDLALPETTPVPSEN